MIKMKNLNDKNAL